jgi:2,3-bisphosphoglycerate-independent phosphoglycerate mutase
MYKALLVVMDGLGDRPVRELGRLIGLQVMPEIINLLGLSKLIGD